MRNYIIYSCVIAGVDSSPTILHEVQVPIISNGECEEWFRDAGHPREIPNIMMCAGYKQGGKDTCQVVK